MKTHLLPPDVNWYRGNLHCHTKHSDGFWPPERVKSEYVKQGYSVIAYSDHNVLVPHMDLADENFVPLTAIECDMTQRDQSTLLDSQRDRPRRFLPTHHINLFAKDPFASIEPLRDTIWAAQHNCFVGSDEDRAKRIEWTPENVNHFLARANEAGFLSQYNHPNWSLAEPEHFLPLKGLWSLEILNWCTEVETGGEFCPYIYDMMLRRTGPGLLCTMGDDNHNHGGELVGSFGGSTMFGAKNLSYESIIDAMIKGNVYCTEGRENPPRFEALYVEDGVVNVECSPAEFVWFVGDGRRYSDYRSGNVTKAQFPLHPDDRFFRIALRDSRGNNALTHAYSTAGLI